MSSALSLAFDNAILRSREALAVAAEIEAAPAKVEALRMELVRLNSEVRHLREVFATEKAAWQIEWKSLRDARDHDHTVRRLEEEKLSARLAEARDELRRVQNKLAAVRLRLEKIAAAFRKLDRMREHPSSGAPGMSAVFAELVELAR
jgi:chromosome segregation ATPase